MLKKLTTLLLLCAVLAACTPKNSNDSQKYANLSVDQIPSFEEYSQFSLGEQMDLKAAMERLPVDACEQMVEQYLSDCLKEEKLAELTDLSLTKDTLSLVEGKNLKPLENLSVDIDAELLSSDVPDPVETGAEVIESIENALRNCTYTAPLTSNLSIDVHYQYGIANTFRGHTSFANVEVYKEQDENEYAAQTIAYDFGKQNRILQKKDLVLQKFGAIPETQELYVEYYAMDEYLLDETVKADRTAALEDKCQELQKELLADESAAQYIQENNLKTLTVSFQNSFFEDGYLTFNQKL